MEIFKRIATLLLVLFCLQNLGAQGYYFGPKGGLNLAFQNFDGNTRRTPLIAYHGDMIIESLGTSGKGSLFASLGYHVRGTAIRSFYNSGFSVSRGFRYNNLSLMLGAKRKFTSPKSFQPYYHIGVRLEYTLNTDFGETNPIYSVFYPIPELVNKFTYGMSGGAGAEFPISEFTIPYLEITFSPDLAFQYRQSAIELGSSPIPGLPTSIPEREIRNFTIELSIGFKFLRKIVYVD